MLVSTLRIGFLHVSFTSPCTVPDDLFRETGSDKRTKMFSAN